MNPVSWPNIMVVFALHALFQVLKTKVRSLVSHRHVMQALQSITFTAVHFRKKKNEFEDLDTSYTSVSAAFSKLPILNDRQTVKWHLDFLVIIC